MRLYIAATFASLLAFVALSLSLVSADQGQTNPGSEVGVKSGSIVPVPASGEATLIVKMPSALVDPRDSSRTYKLHHGTEVYKLANWSVTWRAHDGYPITETVPNVTNVETNSAGVTVFSNGWRKTFPPDAKVTRAQGYTLLFFAPGDVRTDIIKGLRPDYVVP
jgi:hypothetical protein